MKEDLRALLEQADQLKFEEKYGEAIRVCEQILSEDPSCVEAFEEIGDNFISLNQLTKAERALRKAVHTQG